MRFIELEEKKSEDIGTYHYINFYNAEDEEMDHLVIYTSYYDEDEMNPYPTTKHKIPDGYELIGFAID